jgi:hypothetical protein
MALNNLPINSQGFSANNRVVSEAYAVNNIINTKPYSVVCLKEGCFYSDTFEASFKDASVFRTLKLGIDYFFGLKWQDASLKTKRNVHTCVVFTGPMVGTIRFNYNAVGGSFGLSQAQLDSVGAFKEAKVKYNYLEDIFASVLSFPSIVNPWHFSNTNKVVCAIDDMRKFGYMPSIVKV